MRQHAIYIICSSPGMTITNCVFESGSPRDSGQAIIYLHSSASGTPDNPIRLQDLQIQCGGVGIVVGGHEDVSPVSSVRIERCRIQAVAGDFGVPIALQTKVHDVVLRNNLLTTGMIGITLTFKNAGDCTDLLIERNTIHNFPTALGLTLPPDSSGIVVSSNLFVGVDSVNTQSNTALFAYRNWFSDNWLEPGLNCDSEQMSIISAIKQPLPLVSRDPGSEDFLVPTSDAPANMPGHLMIELDE
jgi:hypothetical protein